MPYDIKSGATNVSNLVNSSIQVAGVVSGLSEAGKALGGIKNLASNSLGGLASNLTGLVGQVKSAIEAVPSIADFDPEKLIQAAKTVVELPGKPPYPNVLHNFATFNYIWTLSVLNPQDLNFPDESYRKGKLGPIILKSGSGSPEDRISTVYRTAENPEGKFDFYMDDVRIAGTIGMDKVTGNTNATGISFNISEPYSMGTFFQSLQIAALEAGYYNWLDVPLLLRLEFFGHVDQYKQNVQIPGTTKYFPLKIRDIKMRVSGQGSVYSCEAIPWNEKAHSTTYSQIKTDLTISGSTVQEMLQYGEKSLQRVLNDAFQEAVKRKEVTVPDQIIILFPTDLKTSEANGVSTDSSSAPSATVDPSKKPEKNSNVFKRLGVVRGTDNFNLVQNDNVNPVGGANMGFNEFRQGEKSFGKDNAVYDPKTQTFKRGNITISKTSSEAKFAQGTDIPNVINNIILASDYGRQALDPDKITEDGFINWWRIDTQLYIMDTDANIEKTGRKPNLVVYRVIPYKVHHSKFMAPNQPAKGVEKITLEAIKRYDYLYTAQNLDIIDFAIEFNAAFYTATSSDGGRNNVDVRQRAQTGGLAADSEKKVNEDKPPASVRLNTETGELFNASGVPPGGVAPKIELGTIPTTVIADKIKSDSGGKGGPKADDPATLAARQFHDAITEAADMVELQMKILGDPFYLGDSGMGNYSAQATNLKGINGDGAINNQDSEVYVNVRFRNPIDISRRTGRYDFPSGSLVPQFSGLYRVSIVENSFSKGQFTQSLTLTRMVGQDVKDDGEAGKTLASAVVDKINPNNPESYAIFGNEGE
jgi:hypothetical protein